MSRATFMQSGSGGPEMANDSEAPLEFATLVGAPDQRWLWFIPLLIIVCASMWYFWPRGIQPVGTEAGPVASPIQAL